MRSFCGLGMWTGRGQSQEDVFPCSTQASRLGDRQGRRPKVPLAQQDWPDAWGALLAQEGGTPPPTERPKLVAA